MKKIFYTVAFCGAIWMVSCEKDKQLPPEENVERLLPPIENGDIDDGSEDDPDVPKDYLHSAVFLSAEDVDTDGSGLDLATGQVFRGTNVHNYIHAIDLLYLDFGNATNGNIALPESRELSVNVYGEDIQYGWRYKNEGELYLLENVQPRDVAWFNGAKSAARISAVVDSMITVLSANPDNQKQRYRDVQKDQMLIFKSATRNIASVIYVSHRGTAGNGSQCRLVIKTDATQLQEVPPVTGGLLNAGGNYYADKIEMTFDRGRDVAIIYNFRDKKVYTLYRDEYLSGYPEGIVDDYSSINLIFNLLGTTHRFTTPRSSVVETYHNLLFQHFRPGGVIRPDLANVPSYIRVSSLGIYTGDYLFENIRRNHKALSKYYEDVVAGGTTGQAGHSWNNQNDTHVFTMRNSADGTYGLFKLSENVDKAATGQGDCKVVFEVKYFDSLD